MRFRILCALALTLTLAGCAATSATNTLSQDKRDALRVDSIEVSFARDAAISWVDGAAGQTFDSPAAQRAFLERKATGPIKAALTAEIPPAFRGTNPARLRVPVLARIIVGPMGFGINAEIALVDSRTGRVLVNAGEFNGVASGQGGLLGVALEQAIAGEPIDRVSKAFARALKSWLKTGQALASG
jgi:hypothetical protein